MAATGSRLELGTRAPDFALPEIATGGVVRREDFTDKPLLVMFICNHCPYVQHIADALAVATTEFARRGVAVVGISSNDVAAYPEDSPENMWKEKVARSYPFPYLYDESQAVARAYSAACTPDLFLFDKAHRLVYRGQFDDARPGNDLPVTGKSLRAAVDAMLAGRPVLPEQRPAIGCSIKWKEAQQETR